MWVVHIKGISIATLMYCERLLFVCTIYIQGTVDTSFIADNPGLLQKENSDNRAQKLLNFIGNISVNGPPKDLGAIGPKSVKVNGGGDVYVDMNVIVHIVE
jgi:pyruvate carboxylase